MVRRVVFGMLLSLAVLSTSVPAFAASTQPQPSKVVCVEGACQFSPF